MTKLQTDNDNNSNTNSNLMITTTTSNNNNNNAIQPLALRSSRTSLVAGISALIASIYRLASTGGTLNSWITLTLVTWFLGKIRNKLHAFNPLSTIAKKFYFDSVHDDEDVSFDWIREYLENQSRYLYSSNSFSTSTGVRETFGAAKKLMLKSDEDKQLMAVQNEVQPCFQPFFNKTYWFIYRKTLFRIARGRVQSTTYRGVQYTAPITYGSLNVRCYTKDRSVLLYFLAEAKKLFEATRPPQIVLHSFNSGRPDFWDAGQLRQKRSWDSIVLDVKVKQVLRNSVKDFLDSKLWYGSKGLNWTMGIMLYGPPGTGKTTSVVGLASEFDLPVYSIPLNSPRLHDDTLATAIRSISAQRCIVLLEDVGAWYAAFKRSQRGDVHRRGSRHQGLTDGEDNSGPENNNADENSYESGKSDSDNERGAVYGNSNSSGNKISLSALLNHLDGVANTEGVITILTTNHLEGIDEALMRPGRVDLQLYFRRATKAQAESLFKSFYSLPAEGDTKTPVMHDLPKVRIADLAGLWSATFEDEEFSHAALQGYLLDYKRTPQEAVNDISAWVEKAREKKTHYRRKKRLSVGHPKSKAVPSMSPPPASYALPASPTTSGTELSKSAGTTAPTLAFKDMIENDILHSFDDETSKEAASPPTDACESVHSFQTADNTVLVLG